MVTPVDTIDSISGRIISQLSAMSNDKDYSLVGWERADMTRMDFKSASIEDIERTLSNSIEEILSRQFESTSIKQMINPITDGILVALRKNGLLESFHRIVQFEGTDDNKVKVTTHTIYRYIDLLPGYRRYGFGFHANKEQADSFRVEKLIIGPQDVTNVIKIKIRHESDRGQLEYYVGSEESIPITSLPCQIDIKNSYICDINDFFQEHALQYVCGNYHVEFVLKGELANKYDVVASTISSFSLSTADSFHAKEKSAFLLPLISLPQWSLPGSGYTAALRLKRK